MDDAQQRERYEYHREQMTVAAMNGVRRVNLIDIANDAEAAMRCEAYAASKKTA